MDTSWWSARGEYLRQRVAGLAAARPRPPALSPRQMSDLLARVISRLLRSIEQGGTTLKDFLQSDGETGLFCAELQVWPGAKASRRYAVRR